MFIEDNIASYSMECKRSDRFNNLPVPHINDILHHTFQQKNRKKHVCPVKPPKLKTRYDANCNRSHIAQAISFRGEDEFASTSDYSLLSSTYDRTANESYFDQCFVRLAKIGEGSFGEVFKVRSKEDGLLYAVKMSKQLFRSELYRQERLEEVRRYEQFSEHGNCVRFYRAWEQDDRLYMQMELCRESLEQYLERKQHVPEDRIWSILLDLLLALKSLHDRNLIHLDIKLDNVLISDDDVCKLADFGLVIDVDKARHHATEGDSRYMAPEIMQGNFGKAADIFSLGIAILELSCNLELPANGPLWQLLRDGVLPNDFIQMISSDLQLVIRQMMAPNPLHRPTVNQLLNHSRFIALLKYRTHWRLVNSMKRKVVKIRRMAWSKFCNAKNVFFKFLTCILHIFAINGMQQSEVDELVRLNMDNSESRLCNYFLSSTPTRTHMHRDRSSIMDFQFDSITPSFKAANNRIMNSTPLSHNQNGIRMRYNFRKSFNLDFDSSPIRSNCFDSLQDFIDTSGKRLHNHHHHHYHHHHNNNHNHSHNNSSHHSHHHNHQQLQQQNHSSFHRSCNLSSLRGKKLLFDVEQ